MASRRILTTLTMLSALALVASLGLVSYAQGGRQDQPARIELTHGLMTTLDRLNERTVAVAQATDLDMVREARQELARTILAFDQDLLTLAETAGDRQAVAAVEAIQAIWRELGLDLADLAAGDFSASSAAGRETLARLRREAAPLREHLQAVTMALHGAQHRAGNLGQLATTAAVILGGLTLLLGLITFWPRRPAALPAPQPLAMAHDAVPVPAPRPPAASAPSPASPTRAAPPFQARGDLGLASAAVDRVTVDMLTINRSAERMQQAVDSVTTSLQGMLYSLNELAQDAHEGSRITRTANNAAVYAADTARELLASAREMGEVVSRVRSLAARSQEIAGRIEAEAAATGATGEAFTSVVAQEVQQLAQATGDSTAHIEASVDGILASQRQYEEAIGQIIKNIGMVRKVTANLGELMLEPPSRVQPGAAAVAPPPVATPVAAPEPPPAAAPPPPVPAPPPVAATPPIAAPPPVAATPPVEAPPELDESDLEPETISSEEIARIEDLSTVTDSLLDELAAVAAETSSPAPAPPPAPEPEPEPEPEPVDEATEKPRPRKSTPPPSGSNGNVFMLNKKPGGAKKPKPVPVSESEPEPEPAPEPPAEAPAPEPAPVAVDEKAVDEPEPAAAPQDAEEDEANEGEQEEPVGAGVGSGPSKPRAVPQGNSGNIFMLNKPKK